MDLHERWPHRWLTPKAKPGDSAIHRYGIFAVEKISRGEPINVFGGIAVPRSEIKEYRKVISHAGVQVSDDFFIVPASNEEIKEQGIFNHSCEPNVGFNSSVTMVAITDIEASEELVMNYAFMETDFEAFDCKCGSVTCRKIVDRDTWKDEEFQERYGDYYSPYLKTKLRDKLFMSNQRFDDIEIKKSTIGQFNDGLGVFALRDFKKDEIVIKYNLKTLTEKEFTDLPAEEKHFTHKRKGVIYYYPDPERHVNRYEDPNVYVDFELGADVALRDIKAGEELSIQKDLKEDF